MKPLMSRFCLAQSFSIFFKSEQGVNHLVLHMLQHNGSRDLRTHDSLIINDHAVALMTGLMPDWAEGIGGSKATERAVIF